MFLCCRIVAAGASGGIIDNRSGEIHNFGAEVTGVAHLQKDSHLLIAVGQLGESPCDYRRTFARQETEKYAILATICRPGQKIGTSALPANIPPQSVNLGYLPGAGGGGGSFVVHVSTKEDNKKSDDPQDDFNALFRSLGRPKNC